MRRPRSTVATLGRCSPRWRASIGEPRYPRGQLRGAFHQRVDAGAAGGFGSRIGGQVWLNKAEYDRVKGTSGSFSISQIEVYPTSECLRFATVVAS